MPLNHKQPHHTRTMFTTGHIADICECSSRLVATWIDKGAMKAIKMPFSRDRRVGRSELIRFLNEHGFEDALAKLKAAVETTK